MNLPIHRLQNQSITPSVAMVVAGIFDKMDIVWEGKWEELPKYLRSWKIPKTKGSYFGPKIMCHWLSRYWSSYTWLQNSVTHHSCSNILTTNDPFFLNQNMTLQFSGSSNFSNILVILLISLPMLYPFYQKTPVMTVATLITPL